MSRIITIEKKNRERNTIQDEVQAEYCVFEKDGNKFLQIDTYGKYN